MLGEEEGKKRAAQFAATFSAASAANPDIQGCNPQSVAAAMVNSIITGILPGGPAPGCYLIPKGGALQWWLNHRGMIALAKRAGQRVQVRPIFPGDVFDAYDDETGTHFRYDNKHPPEAEEYKSLIEVVVIVRDDESGVLLDLHRCSKGYIEDCRKVKGAGPVWNSWPLEMAYKTAIKSAVARGVISLTSDLATRQVLDEESRVERVEVAQPEAVTTPAPKQIGKGLDAVNKALDADFEEVPAEAEAK
jgi:recombinational DNA repair protein RecT